MNRANNCVMKMMSKIALIFMYIGPCVLVVNSTWMKDPKACYSRVQWYDIAANVDAAMKLPVMSKSL